MSLMSKDVGHYEEAITYLMRSLELTRESDYDEITVLYGEIAEVYRLSGNFDLTLK